MDDDALSDDKIGKCKINLEKLGLRGSPTDVKKKVDNNWFSKDAYIYLKLSYTE